MVSISMFFRTFGFLALLGCAPALCAQADAPSLYQLSGSYSWVSNSPNGVPGSRQSLNGWDAAIGVFDWHNLRFKADVAGYRGTNLAAPQHPTYILAGGEYFHRIGKESAFVEALMGNCSLNQNWGANQTIGQTASFASFLGGGLDTPLHRRFAFRVQGDFVYTNFHPALAALPSPVPVYPNPVHGLPNYFARITTGLVWNF